MLKILRSSVMISMIVLLMFTGRADGSELRSKFFEVDTEEGADLYEFYVVLSVSDLVSLEYIPESEKVSIEDQIALSLDLLYLEVSDILDIQASSPIKLQVFAKSGPMHEVITGKYKFEKLGAAMYVFVENKIYLSLEDLTLGILAHEIAHAMISDYFVVPPPEKMQEVLAGYVEYKINKP